MGKTHIPIIISHPADKKKSQTLEFLTDSGAVYSVVPKQYLVNMGIKPEEEREFILANGQTMKRKLGIARFSYKVRIGGAPVVFEEKDDSTLLGATTLEAMGFVLNSFKRDLLPLQMYWDNLNKFASCSSASSR